MDIAQINAKCLSIEEIAKELSTFESIEKTGPAAIRLMGHGIYILAEQIRLSTIPLEDTAWRWRRRDATGYYHHFQGTAEDQWSRCGMIAYPPEGQSKTKPMIYERCRACEKLSHGVAANAKGYPHG